VAAGADSKSGENERTKRKENRTTRKMLSS
jgi:hypothetical protein